MFKSQADPASCSAAISARPHPGRVHIVLSDRGWVMEQLARELERRLDYVTVGMEPDPGADANYYMCYWAYRGRCSRVEMAWFTHVEERLPEAAEGFFNVARAVDVRICHSRRYARRLLEIGLDNVHVITPGVDLNSFRPVVKIGVVGRTYPSGRKGEDLVRQVMDEPGIEWHFTGSGWPGPATYYESHEMPAFYNSVDYVLVPAYYEGGPMCVMEALACGKEVIAPSIGNVEMFPHIEFRVGDPADLRRVLRGLVARRNALRRSVEPYSWDRWAQQHDRVFRSGLESKGHTRCAFTGALPSSSVRPRLHSLLARLLTRERR